jgi:dTDP-glucose 4,6-dehydratase
MMPKTILVTGGCGFIGSNFIRYLITHQKNISIINLDLLTYAGNPENLKDIAKDKRYKFVKGDITDGRLVERLLKRGIDAIVNFAAESHVDRSIYNPAVFLNTNILGTQVLIEAAMKYQVPRFIQISTDEVYGSLKPNEPAFTEEHSLKPSSPYSASKAAADLLVKAYEKTFGYKAIITRSSNNYGPYQFPEKVIPLFITNALENKPLPLYGDGRNVRDWIYVEDNCSALDLVLRKGKLGEVYNIGGVSERMNIEITRAILKELGRPETLIHYVKDRPGHDRRYALNITKINRELGWQPRHTFEQGIKKTIGWYLDHPEWWYRVKSGEYLKFYRKHYRQ